MVHIHARKFASIKVKRETNDKRQALYINFAFHKHYLPIGIGDPRFALIATAEPFLCSRHVPCLATRSGYDLDRRHPPSGILPICEGRRRQRGGGGDN